MTTIDGDGDGDGLDKHGGGNGSVQPGPNAADRNTALVRRIQELLSGRKRPVVLLDGPAGAGKTSLARTLVWQLPGVEVTTIAMDDLYDGWAGLDVGLTQYLATELAPQILAGGSIRHRVYDWHAGEFGSAVVAPDSDLLIIEGVGSGQPVLADVAQLLVWVTASAPVCQRRWLDRDGDSMSAQFAAWRELEAAHHAEFATAVRADVVISTEPPASQN